MPELEHCSPGQIWASASLLRHRGIAAASHLWRGNDVVSVSNWGQVRN